MTPTVLSVTGPAPSSVLDPIFSGYGVPPGPFTFGQPGNVNVDAIATFGNVSGAPAVQGIAEFQISSYSPSLQDYIAFKPTSVWAGSIEPSGQTVNVYFSSGAGVYSPAEFSTPGDVTTSFTIPNTSTWYVTPNWDEPWVYVPVPSSLIDTLAQSDGFLRVQIGSPTAGVLFSYAELVTFPDNVTPATVLSSDGPLDAGKTLTITVNLNEPVTVTGAPTLQLSDGEVATYTGGPEATFLTFSYTVQTGDNTSDLKVIGLNLPAGSSIHDAGGNSLVGPVQGDLGIVVDALPPTITINQQLANDTGVSHTDLITSDGHVTLWGTVSDAYDSVSNVEVFDGAKDLGAATIRNGAWTFSTLLSEGSHALYAVATDDTGNQATTPTEPTIVVDTTPPAPFMSDVIKNSNNSLTTLSGMSEAGSTVSVFDGTKPLGTVKADSLGDWSLQANISGGTHQFTETATDLAGNTGASAGVTDYALGGHKTLAGGSGNDFLIAGPNDVLIGGPGNDTFVFNPNFGKDVVSDFDVNHDTIALSHTLFHDTIAEILSHTHDTNAGAVIVVDAHDTITLHGVTTAQLAAHSSDFHFF